MRTGDWLVVVFFAIIFWWLCQIGYNRYEEARMREALTGPTSFIDPVLELERKGALRRERKGL